MNLVAPSPSRTMACANSIETLARAWRTMAKRGSSRRSISGRRARCELNTTKLSLVEVSPSIVMRLNDSRASSVTSSRNNGPAIGASVATKPSNVAMLGAIMPAPLAIPVTVMGTPSTTMRRDAPFGTVSVVMMARTPRYQPSSWSALLQRASPALTRSTGSGSMMTPVEKGSTSCTAQPTRPAAVAQTLRASASPRSPVQALALPAFTTSARIVIPRARCSRHRITGAAEKRFWVKIPQACAPCAEVIRSTSSRDQSLMPAAAVPSMMPGTGSSCSGIGGV